MCYYPDISILEAATLQGPNKIKQVALYLHYILLSGLGFGLVSFVSFLVRSPISFSPVT
jgi:hypothetical protein